MLHIFWDSPKLRPFWREVICTVKHLTNADLEWNHAACLLHLSERPIKSKASLTIQLLNAAKACIPLCWRSENPPSKSLWFSKVNELREMENLSQLPCTSGRRSFVRPGDPGNTVYPDAHLQGGFAVRPTS